MQQAREESRAQPVFPKLMPTTSTLQVSRLGQVDEERLSCCVSLFFSFEPTAFNGCYHCHGVLLCNRVLLDATTHAALDSEGCSAPDGRTWSSCPPLSPHLAKLSASCCHGTVCSPPAQGGKKWGCPLSTCLCE